MIAVISTVGLFFMFMHYTESETVGLSAKWTISINSVILLHVILLSHCCPRKLLIQEHWNDPRPFDSQAPPFWQGFGAQGPNSETKKKVKLYNVESIFFCQKSVGDGGWPVDNPIKPATVSGHFLTDQHTANEISFISLDLVNSNRLRKANEAYHITRGKTLQPTVFTSLLLGQYSKASVWDFPVTTSLSIIK